MSLILSQEDYDNRIIDIDCGECEGEGVVSECCLSAMLDGECSACDEEVEDEVVCGECGGTGIVEECEQCDLPIDYCTCKVEES